MEVNDLLKNYPLESDSLENINNSLSSDHQFGGKMKPMGGFPPIYQCKNIQDKTVSDKSEETTGLVKFDKSDSVLSIKDIIMNRVKH